MAVSMSTSSQRILRIGAVAISISVLLFYLSRFYGPGQFPFRGKDPEPVANRDNSTDREPKQSKEQFDLWSLTGTIPGIPAKVWHSAKDANLTDQQRGWIDTWLEKNPSFRQELLTDGSGDSYVRTRYGANRPDIVSLYTALPIAILKADLLRYLILHADGGIWSDLDVTCEKEVSGWLPQDMYYSNSTRVSLVVGLEFDMEWREGTRIASQLTNWVFAAAPGSRHLRYVIDKVVSGLYDIAHENGVGPEGITLDMISDVVDVTGPKIMTIGIVESLSHMFDRTIDDRDIARITEPRVVGDVVVLPGIAFAARQNGYPTDQGDMLVTHHYAGSWKGPADEARENRKKKEEERKKKEEEERKKKEEEERKKEDSKNQEEDKQTKGTRRAEIIEAH